MIRQLTESETEEVFALPPSAKNYLWNEYRERIALCKIGEGIEVEVSEGRTIGSFRDGIRVNVKYHGMKVAARADRRTRKVVFKRIE